MLPTLIVYDFDGVMTDNKVYVDRARLMEKEGTLKIYENLKKNEYYNILAD